MFDEILENPGFWILAGGGVGMEVLGWILSKNMGWGAFPLWQLLILILGTVIAAAIFANKD